MRRLSYLLAMVYGAGWNPIASAEPPVQAAEMAGYLLVPHERVPAEFNAGFSMYVAAWPLVKEYPGNKFQTGLFGTWMFAHYEKPPTEKLYSDIEGGLGWWRDTRFATETPKFIMGGVALNFSEWANGPGAGKGRDWSKPKGQYAIAQLSPNIVWPPDGLNLKQGTCGQLSGYGYLPLPLATAKATTAGKPVPTGNQCWTLFLNTGNFKGPVTFFVPYFWSKASVEKPEVSGMFLDARPANPNKALQMETQYVPAAVAKDAQGNMFARIAPTSFPRNQSGESMVVHRITAYKKAALWDGVQAWFDGGSAVDGTINVDASVVHRCKSEGGSTWKIYPLSAGKDQKTPLDWNSFATPVALDEHSYGYRWNQELVAATASSNGPLTTLPEYFRMGKDKNGKDRWLVVPAKDVPSETQLHAATFPRPKNVRLEAYVTPEDAQSCWKTPGPVAGPFQAQLGDGSVVTYYWYRFADQPTLLNADMTVEEREQMQKRVELLHRHWKKEKEYLPAPTVGTLADLDPALIVTPPKGFEIGYVPIATRQAAAR